jgi:hypothetical protein
MGFTVNNRRFGGNMLDWQGSWGGGFSEQQDAIGRRFNVVGTHAKATDPNDKQDRYQEASGVYYIFSWDEEANHGEGAWMLTGVAKEGHPASDPEFDPYEDVDWIDDANWNAANYGSGDFYD